MKYALSLAPLMLAAGPVSAHTAALPHVHAGSDWSTVATAVPVVIAAGVVAWVTRRPQRDA